MKELAITLDTEKKQPLYEQIYEALREAILQGRILQGEKLPSTRFEADYLQVSRSTGLYTCRTISRLFCL